MSKIVKFYSDSCVPCKAMSPIFDEIIDELGFYYESLNISDPDNRQQALEAGVRSVPSFVVYTEQGEVLSRSGVMSKEALKSFIEDATK